MSLRLAVVLALLATPLLAQQPLTESIEVRLLEIDVVVTDKAGKPVHGLTAADFELFENGRPQQITNLSEYRNEIGIDGASATAERAPRPAAATMRRAPRTIVILLDPMSLRGKPRAEFFGSLASLIERVHGDRDQVQILTWTGSGFRPNLELTTDRAKVLALLSDMGVSPTAVMPEGMSIEQKEIFLRAIADIGTAKGGTAFDSSTMDAEKRAAAEEELAAMRRKTASMQKIVASLTSQGGKSVVIYASEQFGRVAGKRAFIGSRAAAALPTADDAMYDTTQLIESVVATANANGVAFHALKPVVRSTVGEMRTREEEIAIAEQITGGTEATTDALLLQNEREALLQLAERTGGTLGVGVDGVQLAIERIANDLSSWYSLGWRARSDGSDRTRRIRVRAKNAEYTVRTRATLVEKSDRTRAEDLLVARLFERGETGELDFDLTVGRPQQVRGARRSVPVELAIPADQLRFVDENGESAARFTVLTIAGSDIGSTTGMKRDTRRVTAPQGQPAKGGVIRYTLDVVTDSARRTVSIGVLDEHSGLLGVRAVELEQGEGTAAIVTSPEAEATWRHALARAANERKPLVVYFRQKRCNECDIFERDTMKHPAIARRLQSIVFAPVVLMSGASSPLWKEKDAGLAMLDETEALRARWIGIPDTPQFVSILDAVAASAPNFQRAAQLARSDGAYAGATDIAIGLTKLGRAKEAREVLAEAAQKAEGEARQLAAVSLASLDAREGRADSALSVLAAIAADAKSPRVAAEAWLATGLIQSARGAVDDARRALRAAVDTADAGSPTHASATALLARFEAASRPVGNAIRIVPLPRRVVNGRQRVQTIVTSPAIAKVEFTLDGEKNATVASPPFAAELQFGDVPQTRTVRVVGFDAAGAEVGRDELRVNDAGEVFWVRFATPAAGAAAGRVKVALDLRAPAGRQMKGIALSWNDAPIGTIAAAPWTTEIDVPQSIGILRAVAELDDGRTAEDAVLLNAASAGERAEVQLVDLPVTLTPVKPFTPADVTVREGRTKRVVESVTPAGAAPLTVGILIDWSASMRHWMPNLQEEALRFVESVVGPNDRAFIVAFHSEPRLVQPPTSDRELLRRTIMSLQLQPEAPTSVHDAMIFGLLQFEGVRGRRALIMFTDGLDQRSRYTSDDLMAMSRRSNVPVYIVTPPLPMISQIRESVATGRPAVVPDSMPGTAIAPRNVQTVVSVLDRRAKKLYTVADSSGGRLFEVAKLDGLQKIYDSIAATLKSQALVTIRTEPGVKENEWRAIDVKIAGAEVRTPEGYYAPR